MALVEDVVSTSPDRHQISDAAFASLAQRLQNATGIVLSESKKGLAVSRLSRRLRILGIPDFEAYCKLLDGPQGNAEFQEMLLLLTTNVTRFFRESHHFKSLADDIMPCLVERARSGGAVRIWSAGCSSGEEPYSLAMCVLQQCSNAADLDIRILATDIDRNVLSKGRAGRYRMSEEDLSNYPILCNEMHAVEGMAGMLEVSQRAKSLVHFAELNLIDPWPMRHKFDVIMCRNVVIYFSAETQMELWPRFSSVMNKDGILMIGHSERVIGPATQALRSSGVTQYKLEG